MPPTTKNSQALIDAHHKSKHPLTTHPDHVHIAFDNPKSNKSIVSILEMAQGGHNWPSGPYEPNHVDYNEDVSGYDGSASYSFQHFAPTRESHDFMLPDYQMPYGQAQPNTHEYTNSGFAGDEHRDLDLEPQSTNDFQSSNFPGHDHHAADGPSTFPEQFGFADPGHTYGPVSGSTYPASEQHPSYQTQFSAPQNAQHTPRISGNYAGASWAGQPPQVSQTSFSQPLMAFDNQGAHQMFQGQPQISAAHANVSTPPPGQRTGSHFVLENGSQSNFQPSPNTMHHDSEAHLSRHSPHAAGNHFQFPANQGQYTQGQFSSLPVQQTQSPVGYPSQIPRPKPPGSVAGQMGLPMVLSPYHSPATPLAPIRSNSATSQLSGPRSNSPAVTLSNGASVPSPAAAAISGSPNIQAVVQHSCQVPQSSSGATLQDKSNFLAEGRADLLAQGMTQVKGCPNLFLSNNSSPAPPELKVSIKIPGPQVARWNKDWSNLLPKQRLSCEVLRDYAHWEKVDKNPAMGLKIRQTAKMEMLKLDQEMVKLNGKKASDVVNELDAGSKSKARPTSKSGQDHSSTSDEDSDFDEEERERNKKAREILMAAPPSDPVQAVVQETVKNFWRDPNQSAPSNNAIAATTAAFAEQILKLWTDVRTVKEAAKTAEDKKEKEALQQDLDVKAKCLCAAIRAANEYGDEWTLRNLGQPEKLNSQLCNALRFAYVSGIHNGPLPKAILQLMSRYTTLNRTLADKLKLDKLQKKYWTEIDKESHEYYKKILENIVDASKEANGVNGAAKVKAPLPVPKKAAVVVSKDLQPATKLKRLVTADGSKTQSSSASSELRKTSNGIVKNSVSVSPMKPLKRPGEDNDDTQTRKQGKYQLDSASKRPRSDDAELRASKKVVTEGSSGVQAVSKSNSGTTSTTTTSTVAQARPRSSGSILPGRSRPVARPAPKKLEPQQSSSISTISGLLAEIEKPKPAPKQREEPARAPETAEEKARRLRKESRRGLKVAWKPDHELTEVRIFQHDSAEDEGRASNMIRDARDNKSEGQMLKRGIQAEEDEDGDGEGEDSNTKEIYIRPWHEPQATDFSVIETKQREKCFVTRGGLQTFQTPQQKFMEEYEKHELMAIYTSLADIPPTPKSPPRKAVTEAQSQPTKVAHLPSDNPKFQEIHRRWAETSQFGTEAALHLAISRLRSSASAQGNTSELDKVLSALKNTSGANHIQQPSPAPSPSANMSPEDRVAGVLRLLNSVALQQWKDPNPAPPKTHRRFDYADPKVQQDADAFEAVAAQFAGKPFPPSEPPEHVKANPAYMKEWTDGYNRDMATKAKKEAEERARKFAEDYARQQTQFSNPASQQPAQAVHAQNLQDPNQAAWAAYYASINQSNPYAQPTQTPAPAQQQQYASIMQQVQTLQYAQAQPAQQQQAQHQHATQDPNNQLQTLLSALGGQPQQLQTAPGQTYGGSYNDTAAAMWQACQQLQQQPRGQAGPPSSHDHPQSQSQYPYQHRDREHDRERGNRSGSSFGGDGSLDYGPSEYDARDKGSRGRKKDNKNLYGRDNDHKGGINRALIGTKPCVFWAQGKCAKGDQCTFRHDPNDLK